MNRVATALVIAAICINTYIMLQTKTEIIQIAKSDKTVLYEVDTPYMSKKDIDKQLEYLPKELLR